MRIDPREAQGLMVGIELVLSVVLCVYLGHLADQRWHTGPWGVLAGAALGMAAGFRSTLRTMRKQAAHDERRAQEEERAAEKARKDADAGGSP